jgi:hypothetical protein
MMSQRCGEVIMNTSKISPFAVGLLASSSLASAVTITVNSTADPGAIGICALRDAIIAANTNAAVNGCAAGAASPADTIAFNIPAGDANCDPTTHVCTIAPTSQLPDITGPVVIDGYSQPNAHASTPLPVGDDAKILIRIDASNINTSVVSGVHLASGSDGSTIQGLSIVKPGGANNVGYLLKIDNSGNNTVAGNFIGVEPDGVTVSTSQINFGALYSANSSGNTFGGTIAASRNLVAATNVQAFTLAHGNAPNNVVQGNYFNLDATGTQGIGGSSAHIAVYVGAGGTTFGGTATGAGNVIGTWGSVGLQVDSSVFATAAASIAQGNLIGTDATGTVALAGVGSYGILVGGSNGTVTIGTPGAGNLVRGASIGIYVHGLATAGTPVIQGNHIGVGLDGTTPLTSGGPGIYIDGGGDFGSEVAGGLIGGTNTNEGNVIAFNGSNAVAITGNSVRWEMLGNSMYGNGSGISLDPGSNNSQSNPVLGVGVVGPKTTVQLSGSLNSVANTTYRVQFFANAGCDASGQGQGKVYLSSADIMVTTNPNPVNFGPISLTTPIDRHVITATATDPVGNTSEFSDCSGDDTIFSDSFEGN